MNNAPKTTDELLFHIDDLRSTVMATGIVHGFACEEVLRYSKELDRLILETHLQKRKHPFFG